MQVFLTLSHPATTEKISPTDISFDIEGQVLQQSLQNSFTSIFIPEFAPDIHDTSPPVK